jgi:hypothetical protein
VTTYPVSTVKPSVVWLIGQIALALNAQGADDLYVGFGEPLGGSPNDQIFLLDVANTPTPFAMVGSMGAGAMQEVFGIHLQINVWRPTDEDGSITFGRCADLIDAILGVVRLDPTLGGNVLSSHAQQTHYPSPAAPDEADGRICETELTITCHAVN